jgi:hypothetical protein
MGQAIKIIPIEEEANYPKEICEGSFLLQNAHVGLVHFDKNERYKVDGFKLMNEALENGCPKQAKLIHTKLLKLLVSFK